MPSSFGARRSTSHDRLRLPLDPGIHTKPSQEAPYPSPPMSHSPPPPGACTTTDSRAPQQLVHGGARREILGDDDNRAPYGLQQQQHHQQQQYQGEYRPRDRINTGLTTAIPPPQHNSAAGYIGGQYPESVSNQMGPPSSSSDGRAAFAGGIAQQQQQQPQPPPPRRPKSHVASACVNCKRAHLACDSMFHMDLLFSIDFRGVVVGFGMLLCRGSSRRFSAGSGRIRYSCPWVRARGGVSDSPAPAPAAPRRCSGIGITA